MSEHEGRKPSSEYPKSSSPVSVITRFSFEDYGDSNNGEYPDPANEASASRRSSVSASSRLSINHIGLARPLSAAMISSNDRFTSSVTPDVGRGDMLDSTEHIFKVKAPEVITAPCGQDEKESDEKSGNPPWNPFWLSRTFLIAFILLSVLLVILLIVLLRFSNLHDGMGTQTVSNYYGWTYGPTAGKLMPRQFNTSIY